jgi:ribosome-binding protein aMBF1 (putative translation factor)
MEKTAGISDKELASQIKEAANLINQLLEEAQTKGLKVDISINPHYKNIKTVTIVSIIKNL